MNSAVRSTIFVLWLMFCIINPMFSLNLLDYKPSEILDMRSNETEVSARDTTLKIAPNVSKPFLKRIKRKMTTTMLDDDLQVTDGSQNQASESSSVWNGVDDESSSSEDVTTHDHTFEDTLKSQEGSGDDDVTQTTLDQTSIPTPAESTTLVMTFTTADVSTNNDFFTERQQNPIPESCFHAACNFSEIDVGSKPEIFILESANFTVTCSSRVNNTNQDSLHWYHMNGTEFIFKQKGDGQNLDLVLHDAVKLNSGVYKCLKHSENFCCHTGLSITVYQMPDYKFHMMIVGAVVVASLLFCVMLTVIRVVKVKKYSDISNPELKQTESLLEL